VFGDDEVEDGVPEELEALVRCDTCGFLDRVDVRAVLEGLIEQRRIGEAVAETPLKILERRAGRRAAFQPAREDPADDTENDSVPPEFSRSPS